MSDERGFTLVELLAAMAIGMIVLLGSWALLDIGVRQTKVTEGRVEAIARGRQGMELIAQRVRAQMCLGTGKPAMVAGEQNRMRFFSSLTLGSDGNPAVELREIEFVPAGQRVVERKWTSWTESGVAPNITIAPAGTPTERVLLDRVVNSTGQPFFRYWAFNQQRPAAPTSELAAPLDSAGRARAVQIDVAFRTTSPSGLPSRVDGDFRNKVYVRTADSTDPDTSPQCL